MSVKRWPREEGLLERENVMSEERTVLAYIRTELAFLGVVLLALQFYFREISFHREISNVLLVIFCIIFIAEVVRIRRLKKKRRELKKKFNLK